MITMYLHNGGSWPSPATSIIASRSPWRQGRRGRLMLSAILDDAFTWPVSILNTMTRIWCDSVCACVWVGMCVCVSVSACLSACLSVRPSVHPYVRPSVRLSVCLCACAWVTAWVFYVIYVYKQKCTATITCFTMIINCTTTNIIF